jgi:hypothetical protein
VPYACGVTKICSTLFPFSLGPSMSGQVKARFSARTKLRPDYPNRRTWRGPPRRVCPRFRFDNRQGNTLRRVNSKVIEEQFAIALKPRFLDHFPRQAAEIPAEAGKNLVNYIFARRMLADRDRSLR